MLEQLAGCVHRKAAPYSVSLYELERLTERDLADMGMTRTDAFNETQKPFWEP